MAVPLATLCVLAALAAAAGSCAAEATHASPLGRRSLTQQGASYASSSSYSDGDTSIASVFSFGPDAGGSASAGDAFNWGAGGQQSSVNVPAPEADSMPTSNYVQPQTQEQQQQPQQQQQQYYTPTAGAEPDLPSQRAPAQQQQQQQQQQFPADAPATSGDSASGGDAQQVLDRHNSYRARHGSAALGWSASLAADAQSWANRCQFAHSGAAGQGENLAWGYGSIQAIDAFYAENSQYSYGNSQLPSNFEAVGHFTQLVWRATQEVGCAVAQCSQAFLVCRYSPPGNVQGQFAENVLPPGN